MVQLASPIKLLFKTPAGYLLGFFLARKKAKNVGGDPIPENLCDPHAIGKMLPSYRIAQASRCTPTVHKPIRVGALQPARLPMRDAALRQKNVGGDLIPENLCDPHAIGKRLPSYRIAQASRCALSMDVFIPV